MLRAVFFDFDGTCVDSEILAMEVAIKCVVRASGVDVDSESQKMHLQEWAGFHFDQIVASFNALYNCDLNCSNLTSEKDIETSNALDGVSLVPNFDLLAAELKSSPLSGLSLAIVTSSERWRVDLCLQKTDYLQLPEDRLPVFSAASDLPAGLLKPNPDIYNKALKDLEFSSEEVITIEDSVSGVKAAVAAGIPVVGYVGGSHIFDKQDQMQRLGSAGASYIITDIYDFSKILLSELEK